MGLGTTGVGRAAVAAAAHGPMQWLHPQACRPLPQCRLRSATFYAFCDALVQLVNAQAQELEKLKSQLHSLRRKDTSMYA